VKRLLSMLALCAALVLTVGPVLAQSSLQRQQTQPLNNAPMWRDVRGGDNNPYQTTQVREVETEILIQNEGEMWRRIRNGPVTVYGGWLLAFAFLAIGVFYWWRGKIMLHEPRTGREIPRFTPWERIVHWTTALAALLPSSEPPVAMTTCVHNAVFVRVPSIFFHLLRPA